MVRFIFKIIQKVIDFLWGMVIFLIIIICILGSESELVNSVSTSTIYEIEPTMEDIHEYAKSIGIKFPKVFCAQVVHETGYLKSKVYTVNNNLCGMHLPGRSYCQGSTLKELDGSFCKYESWQQSALDYKEWQDSRFKDYYRMFPEGSITTDWQYMRFLVAFPIYFKSGPSYPHRYATDKKYWEKIHNHYQQLKYLH